MPLTLRQRNIINPKANQLLTERNQIEYDYSNRRNRFVIDAIQEKFLTLGNFPPQDFRLLGMDPDELGSDNDYIRAKDLQAYASLYRQNAKPVNASGPREGEIELVLLTEEEIQTELQALVSSLGEDIDKYTTRSVPETLESSFEALSIEEKNITQLISLPPGHSYEYRQTLRSAMDISEELYDPSRQFETTTSIAHYLVANDPAVDLYDWRKNTLPGTEKHKVYYNANNDTFVYTFRSNKTSYPHYDIAYLTLDQPWVPSAMEDNFLGQSDYDRWMEDEDTPPPPTSEEIVSRYKEIRNTGITKILQFAGKYSQSNFNTVIGSDYQDNTDQALKLLVALQSPILAQESLDDYREAMTAENPSYPHYNMTSYLDGRPGSRWVFRVVVERSFVDRLMGTADTITPSYQEAEITLLQKANTILGQPRPKKIFYPVSQLYKYIASGQTLLRIYADDMAEEGILPYVLHNLDVLFEAEKLGNFSDKLELFNSYNQRALNVLSDRLEIFLSEEYQLLYIAIDGDVYVRGVGNTDFYPEATGAERILNAFFPYTATTFSYIDHIQQLSQIYANSTETDRPPWSETLPEYTYPELDVSALRLMRGKSDRALLNLIRKKDSIFQTIAQRNNVSLDEIKHIFDGRKLTNTPQTVNFLKGEVASLGCNEGFGKLLNTSLSVISEVMGKGRAHKYLREVIFYLRDELISESVRNYAVASIPGTSISAQALPLGALSATQNPDYIYRQVKQAVDRQIHCGLAVTSNFIEQRFLASDQLPPEAKSLVRGWKSGTAFGLNTDNILNPKVELKSPYGSGPKTLGEIQRQVWKKMLTEIVKNMLKSLVIGVFKDVLRAALGCGPGGNTVNPNSLRNSMSLQDYGFADLGSYIVGVDVVEVARFVEMPQDYTNTNPEPLRKQIYALIRDISIMSTPAELQQMLEGSANGELFDLIAETVNGNKVVYPGNRNMDIVSTDGTSIAINPRDYPNLIRTPGLLEAFVRELGRRMYSQTVPNIEIQSPLEAYCDDQDPMIQPLRFILSNEQLLGQYNNLAQEKIDYLNFLCNLLQSTQNLEFLLQDMVDSLPAFSWYAKSLELLSKASTDLWQWLMEQIHFDIGSPESRDPVFNLWTTEMGTELYYNTEFPSSPGGGSPNKNSRHAMIYIISPGAASVGARGAGPMIFPYQPPPGSPAPLGAEVYYALHTAPVWLRPPNPRNMVPEDVPWFNSKIRWYKNNNVNYYPGLGYAPSVYTTIQNKERGGYRVYMEPLTNAQDAVSGEPGVTNGQVDTITVPDPVLLAAYTFQDEESSGEPAQGGANYHFLQEMFGDDDNVRAEHNIFRGATLGVLPLGQQTSQWGGLQTLMANAYMGTEATHEWLFSEDRGDNTIQMGPYAYFPSINSANHEVTPAPARDKLYDGSLAIDNGSESVYRTLNASYIQPAAKTTLNKWTRILSESPLTPKDEPCLDVLKKQQGEALSSCIQVRIQMFMLNVFPLRRVYPAWRNLGTVKLVTDYLTKKIIKEFQTYEMWGVAQEAITSFEYVYGDVTIDPNVSGDAYTQKIFGIVEKFLVGDGVGINPRRVDAEDKEQRGYWHQLEIPALYDSSNTTGSRYKKCLTSFYISAYDAIKQRSQAVRDYYSFGNEEQRINFSLSLQTFMQGSNYGRRFYRNLRLTREGYRYGLYYMPTPIMIAQSLIYYDNSIKPMNRFSRSARQNHALTTAADQALMVAMRGTPDNGYDFDLTAYPISVTNSTIRRTINTRNEAGIRGGLGGHQRKYTIRVTGHDPVYERTYSSAEELQQHLNYLLGNLAEELGYFVQLANVNLSLADRRSLLKNNDIQLHMDTDDWNQMFSDDGDNAPIYREFIKELLNLDPNAALGRIPSIIKSAGINPTQGTVTKENVQLVLARLIIESDDARDDYERLRTQGVDDDSTESRAKQRVKDFLTYYAGLGPDEPNEGGRMGLRYVFAEIESITSILAATRKS